MIEIPSEPPAPGSDAAIDKGCTCPVLDNAHGAGCGKGPNLFWINADCSMHGIAASIALEAARNKKMPEKPSG